MNVKLFIATPAFDGKSEVQYAISLAETAALCIKNHVNIDYKITISGSLLCAERNRLVDFFMKTDCTHMLFVDSDLGWMAQDVLNMLQKNVEFVAGVYPTRRESSFLFRPCLNPDGSLVVDKEKKLLKMEYIPAGFMLLKRSAIEKIIENHPDTRFEPKDKKNPPGYALFNTEIYQGEFWGEDYVFCRRAREAGVDIWVDPEIKFNHSGTVGALVELLTNKSPEIQNSTSACEIKT